MIYLDHNATTPVLPEVLERMLPYLRDHFGNPSSGHSYGRRAHDAVEHARAQVADLLGCSPDEIVFTSGGTESNNLAIRGVTAALPERRHVITSVIEHPAVANPCNYLEQHGFEVTRVAVDERGQVLPASVVSHVRDDTALVTIMHANNEVGTIQPIRRIAQEAHASGRVLVHSDAAQSVGKVPVRVDDLDLDLLSVAGHKLYAPKGIGALYVRRGTPLCPFTLGAGHERGLRPGTENVASIVGLGVACRIARETLQDESQRVRSLRDQLWEQLKSGLAGIEINGHPSERLPNTLNVRFPKVRGSELLKIASEIAASTGSACHEGGESPSSVLLAMGLDAESALGAVRLSLGRSTTTEQVRLAAEALIVAHRQLVHQ
ncbi:MAG TPA: cysteine desulfurase family protein [Myxococcota bacterium]|nr:cysteine desulfurase family protein [Myxococcota bacterium]